ncbi:MAG: hypothetical protein KAH56_01515 [Candidatus Krumholzibacteria bacterium]|nr:hypothetical protein [Candidatus Krumholzibacteria bacterium]
MTVPPLQVSCVGMPDDLVVALAPLVEVAAKALDMGRDVSGVRICGDDMPGDDGPWYRLQPGSHAGELPELILFCHGGCFGRRDRAGNSLNPPPAIWEQSPAPEVELSEGMMGFSAERSAIFLHHHLLTARDLVRGDVVGRNLPAGLTEAFTESWAVVVDGRLVRQGLPGFPLAERRGRFAQVFSPAGILLPDHWQVFESLWDGALSSQQDVLDVVKKLPGL